MTLDCNELESEEEEEEDAIEEFTRLLEYSKKEFSLDNEIVKVINMGYEE